MGLGRRGWFVEPSKSLPNEWLTMLDRRDRERSQRYEPMRRALSRAHDQRLTGRPIHEVSAVFRHELAKEGIVWPEVLINDHARSISDPWWMFRHPVRYRKERASLQQRIDLERWHRRSVEPADTFSASLFAIQGVRAWAMSLVEPNVIEVDFRGISDTDENAIRQLCAPNVVRFVM